MDTVAVSFMMKALAVVGRDLQCQKSLTSCPRDLTCTAISFRKMLRLAGNTIV